MKISFVNFGIEASGSIVIFFSDKEGLFITEKSENDKNISKLFQTNTKLSKDKIIQDKILDIIKTSKQSIYRIEFLIEEHEEKSSIISVL